MTRPGWEGVPDDVRSWVEETYKPAGVAIWLAAFRAADPPHQERMIRLARTPDGGT